MFQPPYGKPWLLYVLLGSSLALNLVMVLDRPSSDAGEDGAEASDSDATSSGGSEAAPLPDGAPAPTAQASAATPARC